MLDNLSRLAFVECLNTRFRVIDHPAAPFDLELIQIEAGSANPGYEVFAIVFNGPLDHFMPQAIYSLEHDRLGQFGLFLVPVSQDSAGFKYEAVFNRLIQAG